MRRLFLLAGFAPLYLLHGCSGESPAPAPSKPRPVLSVVLEQRPPGTEALVGSIEPRISAQLGFRMLGRVVSREANVGDIVKKGETLAALDPSALQLQVQGAKADLASAEAQAANASASEERQRALLDARNTPQAAYDAARQARDTAAAGVQQARAAVAKAQEQLGYAQLQSDFDGIVTAVGAEVGQVVNPGQMVATVAQAGERDAVIDIPDQYISSIKPGETFSITLQSAPSVKTDAQVREIAPQSDAYTRTRRVKLALAADAPAAFRLGSTVTASRHDNAGTALIAPESAVLEKDGATSVWVVKPESNQVALQPVKISGSAAGFVAISDGVKAGDRIVTAGVHELAAGQTVRLDGEEPTP